MKVGMRSVLEKGFTSELFAMAVFSSKVGIIAVLPLIHEKI